MLSKGLIVKVRVFVAAAIAAGVALGTSGCNLIQPQATTKTYTASDGVSANVGDVALRNLIVLSNDGKTGSLMMDSVNLTTPQALHIEYKGSDVHAVIPFSTQPTTFGSETGTKIILTNINTQPGAMLQVTFTVGSKTTTTLVPVLTTAQPEYHGLPTGSTAVAEETHAH